MKKQCSKCKLVKETTEFHKDKRCKDGLYSHCKDCARDYTRKHAEENREKLRQQHKKWREHNKEKIRLWNDKFKNDNKEAIKEYNQIYQLERYHTIPKVKLHNSVGCLVRTALHGRKAKRKLDDLLGYTTEELMEHLEKQFNEEMSWDNYGEYWHVDHIKPQSLFDFESADDKEFQKCWALENLQPLSAKENRKKSNKYRSER